MLLLVISDALFAKRRVFLILLSTIGALVLRIIVILKIIIYFLLCIFYFSFRKSTWWYWKYIVYILRGVFAKSVSFIYAGIYYWGLHTCIGFILILRCSSLFRARLRASFISSTGAAFHIWDSLVVGTEKPCDIWIRWIKPVEDLYFLYLSIYAFTVGFILAT